MTTPLADPETRLAEGDHEALRLWLRLFTCSTMVEREIGAALKREFGSSLPRFDLLAQLERNPAGLRLGELSERLLVTGGNVTFLVTSLVAEGLVTRRRAPDDGRAWIVALTPEGRRAFQAMARAHERWITRLFQELSVRERTQLHALLGTLKFSIRHEAASA
ncbi:MAG: MarR family transcriptional regulator [Gemmatimonadetes bacterium]|nr:MarR family transcriptional regulator [Gemmatimonadota bacterium]